MWRAGRTRARDVRDGVAGVDDDVRACVCVRVRAVARVGGVASAKTFGRRSRALGFAGARRDATRFDSIVCSFNSYHYYQLLKTCVCVLFVSSRARRSFTRRWTG